MPAPIGAGSGGQVGAGSDRVIRMRLSPGKYALDAGEAEIHADGARIAGGRGAFEFDLFAETWIDIVVRP